MQTIIIPTHNRQNYFKKIFTYYDGWNTTVLIVDSSLNPYTGAVPEFICYMHTPTLSFTQKLVKALEASDDEFVTLCADDDFLIKESAVKSFNFLSENNNYVAYTGKFIWFSKLKDFLKVYDLYPLQPNIPYTKVAPDISPLLRVEAYLTNYYQILWATYSRKYLLQFFEVMSTVCLQNDNFIEIFLAIYLCSQGGIFIDQDFWCIRARTLSDHWGGRHLPLAQYPGFLKEYSIIRAVFKEIINESLIDLGVRVYLNACKTAPINTLQNIKNRLADQFFKKSLFKQSVMDAQVVNQFDSLIAGFQ